MGKNEDVEMVGKDSKAPNREKVTVQYDGQSPETERPIKILEVDEAGKIKLHVKALEEIQKDCLMKEADFVSIISVMGALRGGKSFLLDLLLRYLRHRAATSAKGTPSQVEENGNEGNAEWAFGNDVSTPDWVLEGAPPPPAGETDRKFGKDYIFEGRDNSAGFEWCGGKDSHTKGIWLWRTPFIFSEGERKIAVLLMDTQGAWDNKLDEVTSAIFFGFAALMSSKLIYNRKGQIDDNDIKNIDYFTTVANAACGNVGIQDGPLFGELHFLCRDICFEDTYKLTDCQCEMDKVLKSLMDGDGDKKVRHERLYKLFRKIKCFGLSQPYNKMEQNTWYGQVNDLHSSFLYLLDAFAKQLFCEGFPCPSKPLGFDLEATDFAKTLEGFVRGLEAMDQDLETRIKSLRDMFALQRVEGMKRGRVKEFEKWFREQFPDAKLFCPCALDSKIKEKRSELEKDFEERTQDLREDESKVNEFVQELGEKANARRALNVSAIVKHRQRVLDKLEKNRFAPNETPLIEPGKLEKLLDSSLKEFLDEFQMRTEETRHIQEVKDLEKSMDKLNCIKRMKRLVLEARTEALHDFEKWLRGGSLSNITALAKLEQEIEAKAFQMRDQFCKRFFYEVTDTAPCVKDLRSDMDAAMEKRKNEFSLAREKQGDASGLREEGSCADRCCLCNWCQPVKSDASVATSSV